MTGLVRKATLLTVCGVLIAAAAMAGVPSPGNSDKPACISLVGAAGGVPDSVAGKFCLTIRDLANNPLNGSSVTVDFSNDQDAIICDDQLNANYIENCAAKTVRAFTNASGVVCFTLLGGSDGGGNGTNLLNAGRIYADGVLMVSPTVSIYDLDNAGGAGANDLSAWFGDFGSGFNYGRADYDCSGTIGANDLSLWFGVFGAGTSTSSCTGSCP